MTTVFASGRLASLLIALLSCAPPWAWSQTEPAADLAGPSDGWRWRPSLFVLGAYEYNRGLTVVGVGSSSASSSDLRPALALGLETARSGSRGGFQGEVSLLGRDPFDSDARAILFDGRAHAFRSLGSRWRVELDEALRVERREALPRADFDRQQAQATLEYRGASGPAYRLQLSDRRLRLPHTPALNVTQQALSLGVWTGTGGGMSLEARPFFRRFGESARDRNQLGAAFEATHVNAQGLLALRYHFSAALGHRPTPTKPPVPAPTVPPAPAPNAPPVPAPTVPPVPAPAVPLPAARVPELPPEVLPEVPLADALDDDAESWPARQEHQLGLYGSHTFGQRLRLTLRAQVRWLKEREPLLKGLPGFDDQRWHLRATLRWRLSGHTSLVAQAAYASEKGNPAAPELVRSQVFFGVQVR